MLALYRSGRQADALDAYRHAREVLVEQLGIEPGVELRDLHQAILDQRPDLMPSATAEGVAAPGDAWLPVAHTTLYGRDDDVARLQVLLVAPAARVIALVGPGGVGKTRLAIAAAAAVAEGFPDGVRFVDLSAVANAEDVAPAIASAVGAPVGETETTPAALVRFFGDRRSLLVLDNFEQVIAAAGVVGRLVARCPELVVVVTSREPLGLSSERRYPVAPLEVDFPGAPAVAMFLDRAGARAPGYGEGETEMLDVERLCRGLDGLPLALELAAARAPLLSPRELADRLTRVLDVLGPGPSDAPARQRTLRATLEWSVRLLDDEERAAFARLGAFAGGMTIAAAEAVAGVGLDMLDSLLAKQLLARRGDRLVMLETVRAFALERLAEDPHASSVRRALAAWCLDALRVGNPRLRGRERRARLAQLEAELANAVASLSWAIEVSDTKLAMDLAAELGMFWWNTGRREEGIRWLGLALETAPDSDPADLAAVLLARARLTHRRDMPAYRRDLEAALTRFTEAADRGGMALALAYLSYVEASTGRADAAASLARRARALADECGDELIRGTVLGETERGRVASRHEEVDQMRREAVELLSRNDDLVGVAFTCSVAGYEALAARRDADALPWLEEGARAAHLSGHLASLCHVHNNLGLARLFTGDVDGATEALATALRLARPAGLEHLTDEAILAISAIRLRQGDPTGTAAALRTAASSAEVITRRPDEQVVWARIEDELIAPYRFHLDQGSAAARSPQLSPTQAIELAIAETERAVTSAQAC